MLRVLYLLKDTPKDLPRLLKGCVVQVEVEDLIATIICDAKLLPMTSGPCACIVALRPHVAMFITFCAHACYDTNSVVVAVSCDSGSSPCAPVPQERAYHQ